ncbi:hypothetical protein DFH06DRAFT_1465097 [Mycena polygramma]|nr:hypothetical protein DFH06DRAFT_1465097 [Mycena polygramma]
MFVQACLLTLALGAASALALGIDTPTNPTSGGTMTITWSRTSSDPVFSIELNHPSFNAAFAIANNVDPADTNVTVAIPPVPAEDNYTLTFVNVTDINDVFATSGSFSIGAATSASPSATDSASGVGSSGSGSVSRSATATTSGSKASITSPSSLTFSSATLPSSSTPSPFGSINSAPSAYLLRGPASVLAILGVLAACVMQL